MVAEGVVDLLEAVQVEQQQAGRLAGASRLPEHVAGCSCNRARFGSPVRLSCDA